MKYYLKSILLLSLAVACVYIVPVLISTINASPSSTKWCGAENDRMCPSFLLIGERKCGTTSLFQFMVSHPEVLPPTKKEIGFFSQYAKKDNYVVSNKLTRYAKKFPSSDGEEESCMQQLELLASGEVVSIQPFCKTRRPNQHYITGEATATYLTRANPSHVLEALPKVKLLLSLRCPIMRAISHHSMHLRFKQEGRNIKHLLNFLPLNEALLDDMHFVLQADKEKKSNVASNYIGPGMYYHQIARWMALGWHSDTFYAVFQEELDVASNDVLDLHQFLEPLWEHINVDSKAKLELGGGGIVERLNQAHKPTSMVNETREVLKTEVEEELCSKVFRDANRKLAVFLHRPLPAKWKCL